jgi:hypothetical protein
MEFSRKNQQQIKEEDMSWSSQNMNSQYLKYKMFHEVPKKWTHNT